MPTPTETETTFPEEQEFSAEDDIAMDSDFDDTYTGENDTDDTIDSSDLVAENYTEDEPTAEDDFDLISEDEPTAEEE